jgi:hypothetical protein
MRLVAALLCAILLGHGGSACAADDVANSAPPPIPKAWLDKKISVAEAEATHPGVADDRVERFPEAAKPFGFQSREWEALKAEMKPGDEIWSFSSPASSWQDLAGRAGVVLVRDGNPIKALVTMLN